MMREWIAREGVELRGAGTDESPHVYRRLPEVLAAHAGSIRVLHTLRPLGVAMAGGDGVGSVQGLAFFFLFRGRRYARS